MVILWGSDNELETNKSVENQIYKLKFLEITNFVNVNKIISFQGVQTTNLK